MATTDVFSKKYLVSVLFDGDVLHLRNVLEDLTLNNVNVPQT